MNVKFSIRYKILSVVTILLVTAIGFYLWLAMGIFKEDKRLLIFDLNKGLVTTLGAEVETSLRGASDKLKLYAHLGNKNSFQEIIDHDPLMVRMELYERGLDGKLKLASQVSDQEFQKLYNLESDYFEGKLALAKPIPFDDIQSSSLSVWNASLKDYPPLIGVGISVIQDGASGQPEKIMAVVGFLKADVFLKNLKAASLTQAYIVDQKGHVLLHPRNELMAEGADFSEAPIVKELRQGSMSSGALEFNENGSSFLGAYSKTGFAGVSIVSQVESEKAFVAVTHLLRRSFIFALMVSTVAFIATIFLSRTLTRPLQNLLAAIQKVSEGNLSTELIVNSRDEISVLSHSFNQMTTDLKNSREQLVEINIELENKVADRTKKLEEQNHAVKEAQEALLKTTRLASVGEIAGRAAHEVLNPLTSIMARIQKVQKKLNEEVAADKNLLGDILSAWKGDLKEKGFDGFMKSLNEPSVLDPKQTLLQEDLGNINEVFKRWDEGLDSLGNDTQFLLQQVSRIEKILGSMRSLSHMGGQKSQYKAHDVLHDSINIVADLFSKNKIIVEEKYLANSDLIFVDRDELIQVMTNVMKNALHAIIENKNARGKIQIETRNEKDKLIIDIVDNGIGISPENKIKIFENNFSTKSPEIGTGLGLNISRRFVRAFNGDLFLVASDSGETRFRIEIPVSVRTQEAAA